MSNVIFFGSKILIVEFLEHVCMKASLPNDALTDAELLR
jgi:AMMECR1 domain-containing protein